MLTVRRKLAILFATLLLVPIMVIGTSGAAGADPGYCGVSVTSAFAGSSYVYTMRNQCSQSLRFKVWQPTFGRYAIGSSSGTTCQTVAAGGYGSYWWPAGDRYWTIRSC